MTVKYHIQESHQLVDLALSSSRARKLQDSATQLRLAIHFLLESMMNQDLEDRFNDLCVWDSLAPTPKHLQDWSSDFHNALDELNEDERSLAFIETIPRMFDYKLVSSSEVEKCQSEVILFIEEFIEVIEEAQEEESSKEILSTSDVSKMFGVTSQTVLMWCKAGRMPGAYQTPGGTWKIPRNALSKIERLLSVSSKLDTYIPDQEAVNEAVSRRRSSWRK
ncbi:MAG: helix-turn-helix domain-containing protein [Thermoleophilia bacterium]